MTRLIILLFALFISQDVSAVVSGDIHQVVYGKEEAPITIVEYTSLTCHHCADFHLYVLPLIKQKYVNTGQLKIIIKPFPQDKDALMAFKLVGSLPKNHQEEAMNKLYRAQSRWIGKKPEEVGKIIGLTSEQCKKAMSNKDIENSLLACAFNASKQEHVEATPTFFMDGKKVEGAPTMAEFDKSFAELQASKELLPHPAVTTRLN